MPLAPGSHLGPYEIVTLLAAGSMGEVYRARDTRLGRHVAVKVLPADLGRDLERVERLRQEAQAASALNHPNIVAVHDVGTGDDGVFFVVAELVDGVTLRERLRAGPIPPRVAVDYGIQIARGLAAAHEAGIVHRDLKPENVMITRDDRVKIVDFGLAKLAGRAGVGNPAVATGLTLPGTLLGTIAYMSPEQLRDGDVDARADIFGLGTILYEMLAGRRPFPQEAAAELITAILRDDPPPLAGVAPRLDRVVRRALEKGRAARFQSARDLAAALESEARGLAVTAATAGPAGQLPERRIVVLPFRNVSQDMEAEYFSDGLTEELIHELTRVGGLQVVAWHSAAKLKGRDEDVQAIGEQLKVGAVLGGSVRKAGDQVRIAARLIDTATGRYVWSESYDRRLQDLFAIQEEIARAIVSTLTRALVDPAPDLHRASNVAAYDLYLRGRFFFNKRTHDGLRQSIACFEQAVAIEERFALAHAGVADAWCLLVEYGLVHPSEGVPRARGAAETALALDPRSAEAHAAMALVRSLHDWQWPEAEAFYRRAFELGPGYANARHWFALDYLAVLGRFAEAREELELAHRLDPLSLIIEEGRAYLPMLERRYDESLARYSALLELDPLFFRSFTSMGRTYTQMGRYDEAVAMFEKGRALAGDVPTILGALGQAQALAGNRAAAEALLARLTGLAATRYVPSTAFALIHAGLGSLEAALDWLERGCEQRELGVPLIKVHPAYDRLRGEPRFAALVERMGLA